MVAADAEQHAIVGVAGASHHRVAGAAHRLPGSALDIGSADDRRQGDPPPGSALGRPGDCTARDR